MSNASGALEVERELSDLRARVHALEQRIRELEAGPSSPSIRDRAPTGIFEVLICVVGDERFALPLSCIDEVVMAAETTPLPEAPVWVLGMLDVRGAVVPVIDVLARLSATAREMTPADLIVLCSASERRLGLVIQNVEGVARVDAASLTQASADIPHAPYVLGVLAQDERALPLLSLSRLLETSALPEAQTTEEPQP